ncbi:hypothetical protein GCM10009087_16630 [Sphingomonas oligophenolica]|uniref:Uncharacterized protein n=1 Tax=Sphingomonas oligophenolica TaxID=301154 RepID=A0ABU9Y7Q1_9SPHN
MSRHAPTGLFLQKSPYVGESPARQGTVLVVIPGIPAEGFAAQGDRDRDQANCNFIGLPAKGVGSSNDARTRPRHRNLSARRSIMASPQRITFRTRKFL